MFDNHSEDSFIEEFDDNYEWEHEVIIGYESFRKSVDFKLVEREFDKLNNMSQIMIEQGRLYAAQTKYFCDMNSERMPMWHILDNRMPAKVDYYAFFADHTPEPINIVDRDENLKFAPIKYKRGLPVDIPTVCES